MGQDSRDVCVLILETPEFTHYAENQVDLSRFDRTTDKQTTGRYSSIRRAMDSLHICQAVKNSLIFFSH